VCRQFASALAAAACAVFLLAPATASAAFIPVAGPIVSPVNGNTYYLLPQSNWTGAEKMSRSLGGHLVTIRNEEENAWVTSMFAFYGNVRREIWIGLTDEKTEGQWRWSSGETVSYTNWVPGQPDDCRQLDGTDEDYAHIANYVNWKPTGAWNDNFDRATQLHIGNPTMFYGVAEVMTGPGNGGSGHTPEPGMLAPVLCGLVGMRRRRDR
jgi:hypothetical protein